LSRGLRVFILWLLETFVDQRYFHGISPASLAGRGWGRIAHAANPPRPSVTPDRETVEPGTGRIGRAMTYAAWLVVLALLTWFFADWMAHERNPNREVTSRVGPSGVAEVVLQRNRGGHYVATGALDGMPVEVLVDTGASLVVVPEALARRLDLPRGARMLAHTANGTVVNYATRLASVRLGDIVLRDVRAAINPHGEQVLLGMSFLRRLEMTQRGDTLILRDPPG
jgi:aspartyl protease family protein